MPKHPPDLLVFSYIPWSMSGPSRHIMSCAAKEYRVFFIEEPLMNAKSSRLEISCDTSGVRVVVPHLPSERCEEETQREFGLLLRRLLEYHQVSDYQLWANTPKPLPALMSLANIHRPDLVIYDCIDESSSGLGNPGLLEHENGLSAWADIIFTSSHTLYQRKHKQHHHVFLFARNEDLPYRVKHPPPYPAYPGSMTQQKEFIGFMNEEMQLEYIWHAMRKVMIRALAEKQIRQPPRRFRQDLYRASKQAAT